MDNVRKRLLGSSSSPSIPVGYPEDGSPTKFPIRFTTSLSSFSSSSSQRKRTKSSRSLPTIRKLKVAALLSCMGFSMLLVLYSVTVYYSFIPGKYPTQHLKLSTRPISSKYLPQRPRVIGSYYKSTSSETYIGTERLEPNLYRLHKTNTKVKISPDTLEARESIRTRSRKYKSALVEPFETETCQAQYDWQLHHHPNCNLLMEQDMARLGVDRDGHSYVRWLAHGYFRDVWKLQGIGPEKTVLKTLRYKHEYLSRNYDRHRRDAVAMEELTSSPWVVGIYGFCGNSGIFEFADGGSLEDSIFYNDEESPKAWSSSEKVVVAYQVASGLAAVHNHHKEGVSAIAHTDIGPSQYVYFASSGSYKLNDFNRCRFVTWNNQTNEACTFTVGNNPGSGRSPEEYAYQGESEKVDVYSMGNIFYEVMTGFWPFQDQKSEDVALLVKAGIRQSFNDTMLNSTDPFEQALLNATLRCWEQDPKVRASAREIQRFLEDTLIQQGVKKS